MEFKTIKNILSFCLKLIILFSSIYFFYWLRWYGLISVIFGMTTSIFLILKRNKHMMKVLGNARYTLDLFD